MPIDPIKLSQSLMRCPSVTPEDAGVLAALEEPLKEMGFICSRMPFAEKGTKKVDNLYAKFGKGSPNLCFAGHVDVVPVGDSEAWEFDPFSATIKDGMLIGRGAADMKTAIAAWVSAVSEFLAKHNNFGGSLSLLITGDEEAEAINGTRKVLEALKKQGEKIDACIVGEPTNPENLGDMIKIGRRGSLSFTLTVNGVQGHVAYPNMADNPITKLVKILHNLTSNRLDNGTEFFQPSNLEITSVDVGNQAGNVIPSKATAKFNVRFNDSYTKTKLIDWVRAHIESVTTQYILKHDEGSDSFITKPGFLSKTLSEAVKSVIGKNPELSTTGGTSDARFIKDYCPVVEFGMINKTAHKVNEQVAVEDIKILAKIYLEAIELYFKG